MWMRVPPYWQPKARPSSRPSYGSTVRTTSMPKPCHSCTRTADYLSSLWHAAPPSPPSSPPPSSLVLAHLRPLLEGNPKLGLGVLVGGEGGKEGEKGGREGGREGGKGVSPQEVLAILKESKPRVVEADWKAAMRKGEREGGGEGGRGSLFYKSAGSTVALPLVTGATLAMAYLDYLIGEGEGEGGEEGGGEEKGG
ncbi:hypothetical protein VYU27_010753, partial [Nannochloropsis oceanica]